MYRRPQARRRRWGVPTRWGRRTRLPQAVPGRPGSAGIATRYPLPACLPRRRSPRVTATSDAGPQLPGHRAAGPTPLEPIGPQLPARVSANDTKRDRRVGAYHNLIRNGVKCCAKTTFSVGFPLVGAMLAISSFVLCYRLHCHMESCNDAL